jgi:ATP:corrinoid adenosyltransferase
MKTVKVKKIPHAKKGPTTSGAGKRARRKGHNYERTVVKFFKDLGYTDAKTSRLGSRLLDSAKVDICDIPFNVQCKAVEANIDYKKLSDEIEGEIAKLTPGRINLPIIIFHKKNRNTNVVMTLDEFEKFMKQLLIQL